VSEVAADIAILGSGFAGSLTTLIVDRIGLTPVLIDRARHPRFAIGESSTPIANLVLDDLARRYDLPRLLPLTAYGSWHATYPSVVCGVKRGFSFFTHEAGQPFVPDAAHANELLVTANSDDEHSDTQWLRSDVDRFLVQEVERAGLRVLDETDITETDVRDSDGWILRGHRGATPVSITARFLIDATGEAGFLRRSLGLTDDVSSVRTRSRAVYSHFVGVEPWHDRLAALGGRVADHPFCCDDAAQHHVLDGAWLWILRFNNGVTSAGVVIDEGRHPDAPSVSPEREWHEWLDRYPSVASLFRHATVAQTPGALRRTGRLQRRVNTVVGRHWALLPHTAGFVDPLLSTGIAHTLCGIERLMRVVERCWGDERFPSELRRYEAAVLAELTLIDELVSGCYASFGRFRLLTAYSMLYFAAATSYEHRRLATHDEFHGLFLCADDGAFRQVVRDVRNQLTPLVDTHAPSPAQAADFERMVERSIAPFNLVGLCDASAGNMYRYTGAGRRRDGPRV